MNHFHFSTPYYNQTIDFYEKHFAFKEIKQLGKTHVLKNARGFFLGVDEGECANLLPQETHLGFTFESQEEVLTLYKTLKESKQCSVGVLQTPSPRATHFYCSDPSGNHLEIGWYQF